MVNIFKNILTNCQSIFSKIFVPVNAYAGYTVKYVEWFIYGAMLVVRCMRFTHGWKFSLVSITADLTHTLWRRDIGSFLIDLSIQFRRRLHV